MSFNEISDKHSILKINNKNRTKLINKLICNENILKYRAKRKGKEK